MLTRRALIASMAVSPFLVGRAFASEPKVYAEGGIAIDGSDAVAYFTQNAPVLGTAEHSFTWNGAEWRFSSADNLAQFQANPEGFAPQFGGYCAFAVARGYTASTVPEAWTIHDGKLYLNFSRRVRRRWERDIPGNIVKGEANWPSVLG